MTVQIASGIPINSLWREGLFPVSTETTVTFYADLHVHSKFSRATSRDADLEHMAYWARKKGVSVLGTGDFTHPQWFREIREKLVPAEPGLFRLRPDLERHIDEWLEGETIDSACSLSGPPVRFMLEVEISTIYKKGDRTRKVHHLIYVPDLQKAETLIEKLSRIGNLASDGRPILGLDSRHLLEITLQCGEGCYLVPAHIWTPWFAVLGSKSGFDAVEECYGDLTSEIFALETGLSSDPAMNWRLSALDRYTLVSNSDAHSPPKIGREACVFHTDMNYFAIRRALETGDGYGGTVEFFPEEGKYHLDGHRKCGVCLSPAETREHKNLCPVCGKPLTLGVMHRVHQLADRDEPPPTLPQRAAAYRSLIPLDEVLAEIHKVGPKSKTVQQSYQRLVSRLGSELFILEQISLEDVERYSSSLIAEALSRMRAGRVIRKAGFDGEYGVIRLFTEAERLQGSSAGLLFELPETDTKPDEGKRTADSRKQRPERREQRAKNRMPRSITSQVLPRCDSVSDGVRLSGSPLLALGSLLNDLDPQQRLAAESTDGPLLILAGPGTGKTRTLTHRLAHLILDHGVGPESCLAITFTRRAAAEMTERLNRLLPESTHNVVHSLREWTFGSRSEPTTFSQPHVMTFHALGLSILREQGHRLTALPSPDERGVGGEGWRVAGPHECRLLLQEALAVSAQKAKRFLDRISRSKRGDEFSEPAASDETAQAASVYDRELRTRGWIDLDDLLRLPVQLLQTHSELVDHYRSRFRYVSVDEFQDIDPVQYRLLRLLVPAEGNVCVIGDPDQAIYGFRGADVRYFERFQDDYPSARTISLTRNYRSSRTIVDASLQLIAPASLVADRSLETQCPGPEHIEIHECSTDRAEAEFVVHTIERTIGGSTFFSLDSSRVKSHEGESLSFGDFAVLYRTDAQAGALVEAFSRSGMPFQKRSHVSLADHPAVQAVICAMNDPAYESVENQSVPNRLQQAVDHVRNDAAEIHCVLPALQSLAQRRHDDLPGFLSELALGVDVDLWDPRADRVSLLTLHAAKGLEFPFVFIVGCEDGLLPLYWGSSAEADLPEERRLFFVGMTRAQQQLVLTHARRRRRQGKVKDAQMSPFLRDIQQQLLALHRHRSAKKRTPEHNQLTLFEGDRPGLAPSAQTSRDAPDSYIQPRSSTSGPCLTPRTDTNRGPRL